jgi:hypothetical protein
MDRIIGIGYLSDLTPSVDRPAELSTVATQVLFAKLSMVSPVDKMVEVASNLIRTRI